MNVGRELDEMVHEIVMGHKLLTVDEMRAEAELVWKDQPSCRIFRRGFEVYWPSDGSVIFKNIVEPYSTNIEAAWKVVDRVMAEEGDFSLEASFGEWVAKCFVHQANAETPATAICLMGVKVFKALKGAV